MRGYSVAVAHGLRCLGPQEYEPDWPMNILIVDDQRSARRILASILSTQEGLVLHEASSLEEARRVLTTTAIDIGLIDVRLDADARNRDGLVLVAEIREKFTALPVVVTASSEMEEIRAAMRAGAYDYILKDELCEELVLPIIQGLGSRRRLEHEVLRLRARLTPETGIQGLVGTSEDIGRLRTAIQRVVLSDRPVLVTGPTGAGKEVVVRAIHALGPNSADPLLDLNCGAIPELLMESQLFGHERGAFTGADRRQDGYLTAVRRGTLFLDELAELPLSLQAKLLRVLETGRFRRVGATAEEHFQGRVVAATHAKLEERVRQGRFREDLYHRLNVLNVRVPSLDERTQDIPALMAHFCRQQPRPLRFSQEAVEALSRRSWPGNVRQLRNFIDRLAVFCDEDPIGAETVAAYLEPSQGPVPAEDGLMAMARAILQLPVANKLEAIESTLLNEAMALAGGNKSGAARLLGIGRKAVERRLERKDEPPEVE
ncbi:sigma-54-dependent Fis family transcriptional regulator [Corallococcus sp. AB030]|nr:sigma-54-dependent Fis family transcriptional regulator [Corallococcus sp. AB030]